jgi:hypothetical protein
MPVGISWSQLRRRSADRAGNLAAARSRLPRTSPSDEGSTFENGVLTTPDLKIEITRSKVIKPGAR